jgi:hypothetical protein
MPIPKTRDIGRTIKFLKKEKPGQPKRQRTAIALSVARKAGAKIAKPRARTIPGSRAKLQEARRGRPLPTREPSVLPKPETKISGQLAAIGRKVRRGRRLAPKRGSQLTPAETTRARKSLAERKAKPKKLRTGFAIPSLKKKKKAKKLQGIPFSSTARAKQLGLEGVLPKR